MQTDRNAASGGSGKAEGVPERAQRDAQHDNQEQRLVAYRERLEVEGAKDEQEVGQASATIRVTEHPERFEVTRSHDEAVIRRTDLSGDMEPGRHHEFTERSIRVPLYGESNEVVVHKVSEPYAELELGTKRVSDKQTFETRLKSEEIVEHTPGAAEGRPVSVREVEEGYEVRERAAQPQEMRGREQMQAQDREQMLRRQQEQQRSDDQRLREHKAGAAEAKAEEAQQETSEKRRSWF